MTPGEAMWSPETRKRNADELRATADKLLRYRQLADRFKDYFKDDSDNARLLKSLGNKLEDLRARALDRHKRLAKGVVKIGVVGLEKQGKSAFLSAWLNSEKLLPSEAERCTWSTTSVEPGLEGEYRATVEFYGDDEFKDRIASYFEALEPGSVERWTGLDQNELRRLKAAFKAREGFEIGDPDRSSRREQVALVEVEEIAADIDSIKKNLGRAPVTIEAGDIDELADAIRPYIALKDTVHGNRPYPGVRAVRLVTVTVPVKGAFPGVVLLDLPGIDAPSDKARRDTEEALTDEVDVTVFIKDVTRPSLVRHELDLLRTAQTADRSISLKDRLFVVLTKADLFDRPDENGNWHWALAQRNFKEQGIDRVFPYANPWAHSGPDLGHPVARQLMDYYGSTEPVHGLEKLQAAVGRYLSTDIEALDRKVTQAIRDEFAEQEQQLRGALIGVKDALNDREFERREELVFDELFEHVTSGEDPRGLLPEIRTRLSMFLDHELSEAERLARAERADLRIQQIRADLISRLTPEEAESKRRQMPNPGLMNETAVEIEMRKQMRERVGDRIAGLGEDFRNTARQSIERMLEEMFVNASYEQGRLEMLLPGGKTLLESIDALGRSGQVSESVLRYQNMEMAKADVAFEVLSRYFARQIIDILDATDPGDREIREREMSGLEQFFGMGIADRAAGGGGGVLANVKAKLGVGEEPSDKPTAASSSSSMGGFPSAKAAFFPGKRAEAKTKEEPAEGGEKASPEYPASNRDWAPMLGRVREDVERICNFLEALARHPRGLQKYHEEAIRTVHDAWLDRQGTQSLRRWVRSECARIWPHKFAAIEAEQERAQADIDALEELFGGNAPLPGATSGGVS